MGTVINNIKQQPRLAMTARADLKVMAELLFTGILGYIKLIMLILDQVFLTACLCLTGILLKGIAWTFSEHYVSGMVFFNLLWVFLSYLRSIHKHLLLIDTVEIFRTLGKVFFIFVVCSWFFILILLDGFNHINVFLYFVSLFYLFFGCALISNRVILLSIRKRYKDRIRKKKNIFIIGDSSSCELLESYIEENQCDLRLCGYFNNGYGFNAVSSPAANNTNVENDTETDNINTFDPYGAFNDNSDSDESGDKGDSDGFNALGEEFRVYRAPLAATNKTGKTGITGIKEHANQVAPISQVNKRIPLSFKAAIRPPDISKDICMRETISKSRQVPHLENSLGSQGSGYRKRVIRGRILDCVKYFGELEIDEIYCSLQSMQQETARFLIKEADKHMIRIKFLPDFYQILRRRSTINYLGTIPVLSIREEPLTIDSNIIIKRVFDFCFAFFVLVFILSWLTPIIGLLIRLESAGPIFFKQERSGINNKPFKVYKFRSMRQVKGITEDRQAAKNDVRLTKMGAILRRTSLDELPQFINVLLGTMSVVGPRPHMLSHTDKFSKEVDTYMVRHFAKQGITGWAQVNGCRGETRTREDIEQRVLHDVWYIENWSLTLDLKIIFLTLWNIIRGEDNAY